jgi:SAM-dependent methyltransferase
VTAAIDYTTVTEVPGTLVAPAAVDMVRTRYAFAAQWCVDKVVLEVACGPGVGLGLLSAQARHLVGGDYTPGLLNRAQMQYGARVPLVRFDASDLPFRTASFETIILFEAIYFLPNLGQFLEESHRALSTDGRLILATVNSAWTAFNPSPLATRYWSAGELDDVLRSHGFQPDLYLGFPDSAKNLRGRIMHAAKRAAVKMHVIPETMKGKQFLKRLAFGRLAPFPNEVSESTGTYRPPVRLAECAELKDYTVLYAVARKVDGRTDDRIEERDR